MTELPSNRRELEVALHRLGYVLNPAGERMPVENGHIYTKHGAYQISLYSYVELEAMYLAVIKAR